MLGVSVMKHLCIVFLPIIFLGIVACQQHTVPWVLDGGFIESDPPGIVTISSKSANQITIRMSEPVRIQSAQDISNYVIEPVLGIELAMLSDDGYVITLVTDAQTPGQEYILHIQNVSDRVGNRIQSPYDQDTFTGFGSGEALDTSPPDLVYPINGMLIFNLSTTLIWTTRIGASNYTIEIWNTETEVPISGSPFFVEAPKTDLDIVLPGAYTYAWQVHTDIMVVSAEPEEFNAINDTIYVYCADGSTCTDQTGVGNKTHPHQSIGNAIASAKSYGINRVNIAARGNSSAYNEMVIMAQGVSLYGGYTDDFEEVNRDPKTHITEISQSGTYTLLATTITESNPPVILDGLNITGGTNGDTIALFISQCDNTVQFQNCEIRGGDTLENSTGIQIISTNGLTGGGPLFDSNIISGGNPDGTSTGIKINGSSPTFKNNAIDGGTGVLNTAILIESGSDPLIENNTITSPNGSTSTAIRNSISNPIISDNTISTGEGSLCYGINNMGGVLTITNNSISTGDATIENYGIKDNSGTLTLTNNTIAYGAGGTKSHGLYLQNSTAALSGNTITGNTSITDYDYGIRIESPNNITIENNQITSGSASMYSYGVYCLTSHPELTNNLIISGSSALGATGISLVTNSNAIIKNCTVVGMEASGASNGLSYSGGNPTIRRSIIVSLNSSGNAYGVNAPNFGTHTYNCIWSALGTHTNGGYFLGGNEQTVNPLFATGPQGNYYLSSIASGQGSDSPCIDYGNNTASIFGLETKTTQTNGDLDVGMVDIGYHYTP